MNKEIKLVLDFVTFSFGFDTVIGKTIVIVRNEESIQHSIIWCEK